MADEKQLPSWFYKLGHENTQLIRRMPKSTASLFLKMRFPDLTPTEHEEALSIALSGVPANTGPKQFDPHQKLFATAAWLCGASFQQLGSLFNVSRQTMADKIERMIPAHDRNVVRLQPGGTLSHDKLMRMKHMYYEMIKESSNAFKEMDALTLAMMFDKLPNEIVPEPAVLEPNDDDKID